MFFSYSPKETPFFGKGKAYPERSWQDMESAQEIRPLYKVKPKRTPEMKAASRCSIEVSIGNPYLDGDYLFAIVEWVNRTFQECVVNLGDTLYRHNLIETLGEEEAHRAARSLGNAWIARNAAALDSLRIPRRIIRWDHWLSHPEFPALHQKIRAYYRSNDFFRAIVGRDVAKFLERQSHLQNGGSIKESCVNYILEELAADSLFARERKVVFLYSSDALSAYTYLSRTDVPPDLRGLDNSVHVRLSFCKRRRNPDVREDPVSSSRA